jgi:altronate dehydratase small subunit
MESNRSPELRALWINPKDNVATALDFLPTGKRVLLLDENGEGTTLTVVGDIPLGHKIALKRIEKGTYVFKYGEKIGVATEEIGMGTHVHIHNVDSLRGKSG